MTLSGPTRSCAATNCNDWSTTSPTGSSTNTWSCTNRTAEQCREVVLPAGRRYRQGRRGGHVRGGRGALWRHRHPLQQRGHHALGRWLDTGDGRRDLEPSARVHLPMGQLARAREIASAALFLAGDESSYV